LPSLLELLLLQLEAQRQIVGHSFARGARIGRGVGAVSGRGGAGGVTCAAAGAATIVPATIQVNSVRHFIRAFSSNALGVNANDRSIVRGILGRGRAQPGYDVALIERLLDQLQLRPSRRIALLLQSHDLYEHELQVLEQVA